MVQRFSRKGLSRLCTRDQQCKISQREPGKPFVNMCLVYGDRKQTGAQADTDDAIVSRAASSLKMVAE